MPKSLDLFCGMSSGKSPGASFQGSLVPAEGIEGSVISVLHELNPSASHLNTPCSESYKWVCCSFVRLTTNAYFPEKQPRDTVWSARIGWGTNEDLIISILAHRNVSQRKLISETYATTYGEDLLASLDKELSSDFERLSSESQLGPHFWY
ncbi:hypothetical protein K1719_009629 [Acacia pycnantha]|nr:hypothetical protein K1719_009629 [Acacia pycnantha]